MGERFNTPAFNGLFTHRQGVKKDKNYSLAPPWGNYFTYLLLFHALIICF
jgi:hypothetical protein